MRSGRPPKEQHVHRNKPTHEQVVLPAQGRSDVPEPGQPLEGELRRIWDRMWRTPQATQWTEDDVRPLTRLITLQMDKDAWYKSSLLAEMRQLEDRYGMNPYARRQLRWVVENEDEAPEAVQSDKWRSFKVVDDKGA